MSHLEIEGNGKCPTSELTLRRDSTPFAAQTFGCGAVTLYYEPTKK
jgi:hypothetical protein